MSNFKFLLVAIVIIVFCSCSGEDNNLALEGTTWEAFEQDGTNFSKQELSFDKERYFYHMTRREGAIFTALSSSSLYSIEKNIVSLVMRFDGISDDTIHSCPPTDVELVNVQGTINGNTIYFPKIKKNENVTFYRQ